MPRKNYTQQQIKDVQDPPNFGRPHVKIEEFDATSQKWTIWVHRFENAIQLSGIHFDQKRNYFLHFIGYEAYEILCSRLSPNRPEDESYEDLVGYLTEFYDPAPLEIAECFRFQQRKQGHDETLLQFLQALRAIATNCNFKSYLPSALRNQFVFGIRDLGIQRRLLEERNLTLERAIEISTGMELSVMNCQNFHRNSTTEVEAISNTKKKEWLDKRSTLDQGKKPFCFRCGSSNHLANRCQFKDEKCHNCGKIGHLKAVCRSAPQKSIEEATLLEEVLSLQDEHSTFRDKFRLELLVNNKQVKFEVDTGAAVTLIGLTSYKQLFGQPTLEKSDIKLISYCKTPLNVLGFSKVKVRYRSKDFILNFYVINNDRGPLLGREWIRQIGIKWEDVNNLQTKNTISETSVKLEKLLNGYNKSVFQGGIGKIENIQASLRLKEGTKPIFIKARPVPFALKPKIEKEIQNLVEQDILEKVDYSEWATPVVPVVKGNGSIRLCGDFKTTLNPYLIVDEHPLPTIDELFSSMAGGQKFTKIDLSQAYLHMQVREEDRHLLTLNTHKGLYQCKRLLFGVASAPAIFQRNMEIILQGIPGISVFLDDIKITAPDDNLHLDILERVLKRLEKYNLRVNLNKCVFLSDSIEYCGYKIDKNGVHKIRSKVEAIENTPIPTNKSQVKAFMGFVTYYGRFIRNLSSLAYPLNNLLKDNEPFLWNKACQQAFEAIKKELMSDDFLVHFDPSLPLIIAADASPYGVGAVLSHTYPDGSERPIQFASKTLNTTQQRYSQIDKEAYSIVFAVKKFFQFLYGRKFTLFTDHKPLLQIFSPDKALPVLSATRMQHYALFLQQFQYQIKYKPTKHHLNADALSRLPHSSDTPSTTDEPDLFEISQIATLPVTQEQIAKCTEKDELLMPLLQGLQSGQFIPPNLRFNINQNEFGLNKGCIFRGHRVVIPSELRAAVLSELHRSHFGVVKMKALARSYCWWPKIDSDIEGTAGQCRACNLTLNNPTKERPHPWQPATRPFERVHIDFAGPFKGKSYFLMIDAFTRWPEVHAVTNTTTDIVIGLCRKIFSTFGLPAILVSDNGPQFQATKFQRYLQQQGILHKLTAPYHPSSNGMAERHVQNFKQALRKAICDNVDKDEALSDFLLQYRKMPHSTTNLSPGFLMFNREIQTRIDLMIGENNNSGSQQPMQRPEPSRTLHVGERVVAREYEKNRKWSLGKIEMKQGSRMYLVSLDDGRKVRRHIDQLRKVRR